MRALKFSMMATLGLMGTSASVGIAQATPSPLFTVTFSQVGNDVVATGSGTINLTGLTYAFADSTPAEIQSSSGYAVLGSTNANSFDMYRITQTPSYVFGTDSNVEFATSGSGVGVLLDAADGLLGVPTGYVSGAALSDTDTWSGTTLAALGLTAGSFSATYDVSSSPLLSGVTASDAPTGGTITVVVNSPSSVPEPASMALLALPLMMLGAVRMRRG